MISTNSGALFRRMAARGASVRRELEKAARVLAPALNAESKKIQQERIYNVPIPARKNARRGVLSRTTKGRHGRWMRTGNLKRQETATAVGTDVILRNNAEYAIHRHNLGLPGKRQPKSPGVQSVQWQAEAIKNRRTFILEVRRKHVLRALQ